MSSLKFLDLSPDEQAAYGQLIEIVKTARAAIPEAETLLINAIIATGRDTTIIRLYSLLEELVQGDARDTVAQCYSRPIAIPEPWIQLSSNES